MKKEHAQVLASAIFAAAMDEPPYKGNPHSVFSRVRRMLEPGYESASWATDTQTFLNKLKTDEMIAALMEQDIACWLGEDGELRLILFRQPKSPEEARAFVGRPAKLGPVCRYCGLEELDKEALEPAGGVWLHTCCRDTWQRWKRAADGALERRGEPSAAAPKPTGQDDEALSLLNPEQRALHAWLAKRDRATARDAVRGGVARLTGTEQAREALEALVAAGLAGRIERGPGKSGRRTVYYQIPPGEPTRPAEAPRAETESSAEAWQRHQRWKTAARPRDVINLHAPRPKQR